MAVEDAYELAYREAVRALDHQRAAATELRSRAGMLLATASITVSLLGHESLHGMPLLAWAAIVCFALLSICVLAVVWPQDDWSFGAEPQALLIAHLSTGTPSTKDLCADLIAHIATHRQANGRRLAQMSAAFRVGACLLAIQIVLTTLTASAIV